MERDRDLPRTDSATGDSTFASGDRSAVAPSLVFTVPADAESARRFTSEKSAGSFFDETRRAVAPTLSGPRQLRREPPSTNANRQQLINFYKRYRTPAVVAIGLVILAVPTTMRLSPVHTPREAPPAAPPPSRQVQVQSTTVHVASPSRPELSKALPMAPINEPSQPLQELAMSPAGIAEPLRPKESAPVVPAADRGVGRDPDVAVAAAAAPPTPAPTPGADGIKRVDLPLSTLQPELPARSASIVAPERPIEAPVTPPPAAAATGTGGPSVPDERDSIKAVLSQYELAYSDLDVNAAARVYPALDKKALSRAFAALDSQQIRLSDCRIQMGGPTAHAVCMGTVLWSPKVGGGIREQPRQWQFDLQRRDEGWQIGNVRVR